MKLFHETFVDNEKLAPFVRKIGVAHHRIVRSLPDEMKGMLPTPEQIEKTLAEI